MQNSCPHDNAYGEVARIYDILMTGVPHGAWLTRIERGVRSRRKAPQSALDIACGTGLVTFELARRGYAPVVGIDLSPTMIEVAEQKRLLRGPNATFLVQDMAELDLGNQQFDLVVSLFDSLNYVTDPERLQEALHRIYRHTAPGGVFAFDLNSVYALATQMFTQDGEFGPVSHDWIAHWDEETRLCRVEMDFWVREGETKHHFHETHLQRAYTISEMSGWLGNAGFVKVDVFGNYGIMPPTKKSDRLLFLCERE